MPDWTQIVHDYEAKIKKLEEEAVAYVENEVKVYKINLVAAAVALVIGFVVGWII